MIESVTDDLVRGWLHVPEGPVIAAIVLAHGAGSDGNSRVLQSVASSFAAHGCAALRIDLPFRQLRPKGSPHPSMQARDREGIATAALWLKQRMRAPVLLGGHSYGGRQTSMLVAENPGLTARLLLLSYPLHPPGKPGQLRTAHFAALSTPALFVHGTNDPFGSPEEMRAHLPRTGELMLLEKAGHELKPLLTEEGATAVVRRFLQISAT